MNDKLSKSVQYAAKPFMQADFSLWKCSRQIDVFLFFHLCRWIHVTQENSIVKKNLGWKHSGKYLHERFFYCFVKLGKVLILAGTQLSEHDKSERNLNFRLRLKLLENLTALFNAPVLSQWTVSRLRSTSKAEFVKLIWRRMLNCSELKRFFFCHKMLLLTLIVWHRFVVPFADAFVYSENTTQLNNPNALASKALHPLAKWEKPNTNFIDYNTFPFQTKEHAAFGNQAFAWVRCFSNAAHNSAELMNNRAQWSTKLCSKDFFSPLFIAQAFIKNFVM